MVHVYIHLIFFVLQVSKSSEEVYMIDYMVDIVVLR